MSWTITPQTKVPVDPQYGSVSLLLHGDGTNGSTTITDNSPTPKTVTAVGDAKISTAQSKFGGSSIAFDGTGDRLSIPAASLFNFENNNFTVEAWIYLNAITSIKTIVSNYATSASASGWGIFVPNTGIVTGQFYSGISATNVSSADPITTANWVHVAFVRNSNLFTLYLNGVGGTSVSSSATLNNSSNLLLIGSEAGTLNWDGYIDDLRITKGIARYTANFTPPAAPFPDI
jgi:hypothetical protein